MSAETELGIVSNYFGKIGVAAIRIDQGTLSVGETIRVKGHTSDFTMPIDSMQIEHLKVQTAKAGETVGLKVPQKCHQHDKVLKVTP